MATILYKEEVYEIVGVCMEIHRILGFGFSEVVYKDAMELEFVLKNMVYSREREYAIIYKETILKHKFCTDFTLYDKIITEVKSSGDGISDATVAQTLNYLKASGYRVGLLINFGRDQLEYRRLIY